MYGLSNNKNISDLSWPSKLSQMSRSNPNIFEVKYIKNFYEIEEVSIEVR